MKKLKCNVKVSTSPGHGHISQIITGLLLLKRQNLIDLDIKITPDYPFTSIVELVINNEIKVLYDTADGYTFDNKTVIKHAEQADFYFKRSFNYEHYKDLGFGSRIYPLGLNYHVTVQGNPLDKPKGNIINKINGYLKVFLGKDYNQNFYFNKFEDSPHNSISSPLVLFTTRTWSTEYPTEESYYIDHSRAEIIRKLKKELGNNFIGGFSSREHAKKYFPDCVLEDSLTNRVNFMALVKQADICISTMGLHGSNGWKLGEYVAASKAIVSERLRYNIPGDFSPDKNYLEFDSVNECVEQTTLLFEDKELISSMKKANHEYYNTFLRPDKLILNSLIIATNK